MIAESRLDEKNSENEILNQELQRARISESFCIEVYEIDCVPIDTTLLSKNKILCNIF